MAVTATVPGSMRGTRRVAARRQFSAAPLTWLAAPALLPACAFAAGVAGTGCRWCMPGWLLLAVLVLGAAAGVATARAPRMAAPALLLLFLCLGALAAELEPPVNPQTALAALAGADKPLLYNGVVVQPGAVHDSTREDVFRRISQTEQAQRIDLRLSSVQVPGHPPQALRGGLRLTVYAPPGEPLPALGCGMRVQVAVTLHPQAVYIDPGVWDVRAWLLSQGIGAAGAAPSEAVRVVGREPPAAACRLLALQAAASGRVMRLPSMPAMQALPAFLRLTPGDAGMLTAMLTGDRSALDRAARTGFERTGAFHLLVVSGLHLAIFSSVVLWLARLLRMGRLWATAVTLSLSLGYALFTGFGEPVRRSLCMVALYLIGRLLFRERHALQAMAVAALVLIAASPRALGASSLQMTLLTVVAVAGFAAPFAEHTFGPCLRGMQQFRLVAIDAALPPGVAQLRVTLRMLARRLEPAVGRRMAWSVMPGLVLFGLRVVELIAISALVELVMALPMALYFHRVTVLGLPVNVLVIPLLGLLLPAAMACFVTLLAAPALALFPSMLTALLLHTVCRVIDWFAGLAGGNYRMPAPPPAHVVLWLALVAGGVVAMRARRRAGLPCAALLLMAATALVLAPMPLRHDPHALQVSVLDVGQGDAILVITPDGWTMLVDAGGLVGEPPDSRFDIGEEVVSPALWARGVRRLDAVAISHAHLDHIGGMPAVLANFRPQVLIVGNNPLSHTYAAILAQAAQQHIPVQEHRTGDAWTLGSTTSVQALWPSRAYRPKAEPGNNDSLVLLLRWGKRSALLEGDAQALAEAGMLRARGLQHVDLLKVGHHGSLSSTTPAFLDALAPRDAVISCGLRNFYAHPKPGTLQKLEASGAATYRTDLTGEDDFLLRQDGVFASPWAAGRR